MTWEEADEDAKRFSKWAAKTVLDALPDGVVKWQGRFYMGTGPLDYNQRVVHYAFDPFAEG